MRVLRSSKQIFIYYTDLLYHIIFSEKHVVLNYTRVTLMYDRKLKHYFEVCNLKNVRIIFYNNILIVLHSTIGLYDS